MALRKISIGEDRIIPILMKNLPSINLLTAHEVRFLLSKKGGSVPLVTKTKSGGDIVASASDLAGVSIETSNTNTFVKGGYVINVWVQQTEGDDLNVIVNEPITFVYGGEIPP